MSGETLADPAELPVGVCAAIYMVAWMAVFSRTSMMSMAQLCATAKRCPARP
jgi:hypothetical protein